MTRGFALSARADARAGSPACHARPHPRAGAHVTPGARSTRLPAPALPKRRRTHSGGVRARPSVRAHRPRPHPFRPSRLRGATRDGRRRRARTGCLRSPGGRVPVRQIRRRGRPPNERADGGTRSGRRRPARDPPSPPRRSATSSPACSAARSTVARAPVSSAAARSKRLRSRWKAPDSLEVHPLDGRVSRQLPGERLAPWEPVRDELEGSSRRASGFPHHVRRDARPHRRRLGPRRSSIRSASRLGSGLQSGGPAGLVHEGARIAVACREKECDLFEMEAARDEQERVSRQCRATARRRSRTGVAAPLPGRSAARARRARRGSDRQRSRSTARTRPGADGLRVGKTIEPVEVGPHDLMEPGVRELGLPLDAVPVRR